MSRSDVLRHTLHDPDRYLGPADQEPGLLYQAVSGLAALVGSVVLTAAGIGGWLFVAWLVWSRLLYGP